MIFLNVEDSSWIIDPITYGNAHIPQRKTIPRLGSLLTCYRETKNFLKSAMVIIIIFTLSLQNLG